MWDYWNSKFVVSYRVWNASPKKKKKLRTPDWDIKKKVRVSFGLPCILIHNIGVHLYKNFSIFYIFNLLYYNYIVINLSKLARYTIKVVLLVWRLS